MKLQVTLADQPGALASLATVIGEAGANIVEIYHDRMNVSLELSQAEVEVVLGTRGPEYIEEVIACLREQGYDVERMG